MHDYVYRNIPTINRGLQIDFAKNFAAMRLVSNAYRSSAR